MPDSPAPRLHCLWHLQSPGRALDPDRLREQLDEMRADGYDGVVPGGPAATDPVLPPALEHARHIGLLVLAADAPGLATAPPLRLDQTPAALLTLARQALAAGDATDLILGRRHYWPGPDASLPGQYTWREALPTLFAAIRAGATPATAGKADCVHCPIRWDPIEPEAIALPLPLTPEPGGHARDRRAVFHMAETIDGTLLFTQPVETVRLNGTPLPVETLGALQLAVITGEGLSTDNLLQFRATDDAPRHVSLLGDFSVHSATPWHATADGYLTTLGPLQLADFAQAPDRDLVRGGFPSLYRPALMAGTFRVERASSIGALSLGGLAGDAAQLAIDGEIIGWTWGPDWSLPASLKLAPGVHDIELALAPPTVNYYYSPPAADAPPWRFRPCQAPDAIRLHLA